jgi:hypothetical protein
MACVQGQKTLKVFPGPRGVAGAGRGKPLGSRPTLTLPPAGSIMKMEPDKVIVFLLIHKVAAPAGPARVPGLG